MKVVLTLAGSDSSGGDWHPVKDYQHFSINLSYFWILSRTPCLDKEIMNRLLGKAKEAGFDINVLIYPDQSKNITK